MAADFDRGEPALKIHRRPPPARFLAALVASAGPVLAARRRRGPLLPSWSFGFEWMIATLRRDWDRLWRLPAPVVRSHHERLVGASAWLREIRIEEATADVLREMPHAAPLFAERAPEGARGRTNVALFVRAQLLAP